MLAGIFSLVPTLAFAADPDELQELTKHHYGHKVVSYAVTSHDSGGGDENSYKDLVGKLWFTNASARHYCTAQFVDNKVLLTAAHCTQGSSDFFYIPPGVTYDGTAACPNDIIGAPGEGFCVAQNKNWLAAKAGAFQPDNLYISARYDFAFVRTKSGGESAYFATSLINGNIKELRIVGYPKSLNKMISSTWQLPNGGFINEKFSDVLHPSLRAAGSTDLNFGYGGVSGGAWFHKHGGSLNIVSLNSSVATDAGQQGDDTATYNVVYGPKFDSNADADCYRLAAKSGNCVVTCK